MLFMTVVPLMVKLLTLSVRLISSLSKILLLKIVAFPRVLRMSDNQALSVASSSRSAMLFSELERFC